MKFTDLQAVLNFMYHGEVNVAQEDLNSFLAVAEDLRVKGLTQNQASASSNTDSSLKSLTKSSVSHIQEKDAPIKHPRPNPTPSHSQRRQDGNIQEVSIKSEPKEPPMSTYTAPPPPAVAAQIVQPPQEDHSLTTYQEENTYEDYEQYGDDQQYEETNTSMDHITIQNTEQGKGR